ncbi:MAG: chromosomal replication initiator DnaA [Roseicyclus sp.]
MERQLVLDLPVRPAMGRGDFFVSGSNAAAVARVEGWRDWAFGKLVLTGPEGAGKTHLAHVWAQLAEARIVAAGEIAEAGMPELQAATALVLEGVETVAGDPAAETRLFHLLNALGARGAPILLTSRVAPSRMGLALPDLESRLAQAELVAIEPPDDALLSALIVKLAHDRGLRLSPAILSHAVLRLERSAAAARAFVARVDALALAAKRPARLADARAALAELGAPVSPSRHQS